MTYSSVFDSIRPTSQYSSRVAAPIRFVLHGAAGTSLEGLSNMIVGATKQVSAHGGFKDSFGIGWINEEHRAWSLSDSLQDSLAYTLENANESTIGYTFTPTTEESIAQWVAEVSKRKGIWPHRDGEPTTWTVIGHREVYTIHGGSYATACPQALNLDWIARRAQQILKGGSAPSSQGDEDMPRIYERGANTGDFALVPTYNGYKRFKIAGFPNDRNVIASAHGPIIQMFAADFDNMEKYVWSQLVPPVSSGGSGGSFPTDYAKEATVIAVGKSIPTAEQNGAASRAAIVK